MSSQGLTNATTHMRNAKLPEAAINVFTRFYHLLENGETGYIRESDTTPLTHLDVDHLPTTTPDLTPLHHTAIIKLNGGLATSMGLDRAKSLLTVRTTPNGTPLSFLDITVRQILAARTRTGAPLPLLLMNSFRTQQDTLNALTTYPDLPHPDLPLDFLQHKEPKLLADTLEPVQWPTNPTLEWCPPGHGDLYTALYATGILTTLLNAGYRYAAISNSDNLGATPNEHIAAWFAATNAPYAAEVVAKTPADRKGGTLVRRQHDGRLALRDTAQIHPDDIAATEDIDTHPYFHTNNLWFNLEALAAELDRTGGVLELPLIRNTKTVDPTDSSSPQVVQIESAMGAAISVFDGARALEVPRSRFLPVKTTNDLLVVRSDVYELNDSYELVAQTDAPLVDLDTRYYRSIADFDQRVPATPSLRAAVSLRVRGDVTFQQGVTVRGDIALDITTGTHEVAAGSVLEG